MRFITFALKFAGCALLLTFPMILSHAGNRAEQFPIRCVKLLPSRFADNMRRDSAWMMSITCGRPATQFPDHSRSLCRARRRIHDHEETRRMGVYGL
jgi:hypothetical protein